MKSSNNCTLLICSCDKYSDIWDPFFKLMSINWADCPYPIVLNTESKHYNCPYFDVGSLELKNCQNIPWGGRLRKYLRRIDTEYVIIMLDDFFLYDKVDQSRIDDCIAYMDKHKNTAHIRLFDLMYAEQEEADLPGFGRYNGREYKMSLQAAIWRRRDLLRFTLPHYSPWNFEAWGSGLAHKWFKEDFLLQCKNDKTILPYDFRMYGISQAKWQKYTPQLFEKFGIDIDYSKRGFIDLALIDFSGLPFWKRVKHRYTLTNAMILIEAACSNVYNCFYYTWHKVFKGE